MVAPCEDGEFERIYAIINEAAAVYQGIIPADRWKEPYMSRDEFHFYEKHGFRLVPAHETARLLKSYWSIPERQIETSVVLADARWFA